MNPDWENGDNDPDDGPTTANQKLTTQDLALGKIAFESFAEQQMARGANLPSWHAGPLSAGLPPGEREVWARVAQAVRDHVTFVITDEVRAAASRDAFLSEKLRSAAQAAGFRVVER